ncbi:hypothetical protein V8E36_003752 [Tilletia maclaganii]
MSCVWFVRRARIASSAVKMVEAECERVEGAAEGRRMTRRPGLKRPQRLGIERGEGGSSRPSGQLEGRGGDLPAVKTGIGCGRKPEQVGCDFYIPEPSAEPDACGIASGCLARVSEGRARLVPRRSAGRARAPPYPLVWQGHVTRRYRSRAVCNSVLCPHRRWPTRISASTFHTHLIRDPPDRRMERHNHSKAKVSAPSSFRMRSRLQRESCVLNSHL